MSNTLPCDGTNVDTSIPLLAPTSNIHGNRLRCYNDIFPSQARANRIREESSIALRPHLLALGSGLLSIWFEQLHQDSQSVLAAASVGPEWSRDANSESYT